MTIWMRTGLKLVLKLDIFLNGNKTPGVKMTPVLVPIITSTKIRWHLLSVSHDFRVAFWYFNSLIFWSWIMNECVKWTEFKSASSIDHWWIIKYWIQDYREWCRMHVMLWMIQWSIDALFTNIGDWCHLEAHYHKQ